MIHVVARQVIATKHFAIHKVVAQYSTYSNALCTEYSVVDLEIFRGGFSFTKMPAKLEVKTKKTERLQQHVLQPNLNYVQGQN